MCFATAEIYYDIRTGKPTGEFSYECEGECKTYPESPVVRCRKIREVSGEPPNRIWKYSCHCVADSYHVSAHPQSIAGPTGGIHIDKPIDLGPTGCQLVLYVEENGSVTPKCEGGCLVPTEDDPSQVIRREGVCRLIEMQYNKVLDYPNGVSKVVNVKNYRCQCPEGSSPG